MKKIFAAMLCVAVLLCMGAAPAEDYAIATDNYFRPFVFTNEAGELVGIDIDLMAAIAEDQGFTYTIDPLGWDDAIEACQEGEKDGMIAAASITDARKAEGWIFSDGYFSATQSMAVAEGSDAIKSFEDLKGHKVAVKDDTLSEEYVLSLEEQYGFKVKPDDDDEAKKEPYDIEIRDYDDSLQVYEAVIGGECEACYDDTPVLTDYIKSGGVLLQMVEGTANEGAEYGFVVFSPDKQELIDKFNAGLANVKTSGKYDEILAKYLGE